MAKVVERAASFDIHIHEREQMRIRIVFSVFTLIAWYLLSGVLGAADGPIRGAAAVHQLNGGNAEYTAAREIGSNFLFNRTLNWGLLVSLLVLWVGPIVRAVRGNQSAAMALLVLVLSGTTGCIFRPYATEPIIEVGPSETAFVIQMEGDSQGGQDAFKSVDFLNQHKVATKRIVVPVRWRDTGRMPGDGEYIPLISVIKVDRKPVTREWTRSKGSGSTESDQALHVESKDSIGFSIGANTTGYIPEEKAADFLYHFGGKDLAHVMDENVRGYLQIVLSREFGNRLLGVGREQKKEIFDAAFSETKAYFEPLGVVIGALGFADGMEYDEQEIQTAINRAFEAQMNVDTETQNAAAQVQVNLRKVSEAEAARKAAEEFAKAQDAAVAKVKLDIENKRADAMLAAAQKWDGRVPEKVLPQGSNFLFGLDASK